MSKVWTRVGLFMLTTGVVVLLPWWFSVIILLIQSVFLVNYVEVIFFGFLIDTLYSSQYAFPYTAIVISTVFVLLVMFVRTRIRT
ncbi:MAG: hypothetical protein AB201_03030 [Parcubacteria bacterium C7867-006]|nr:MAG: hypothetical protein AB201_03030 [Parcubacteria bacterium C7867-006]